MADTLPEDEAQKALPFLPPDSPYQPDSVDGPTLTYGEGGAVLTYLSRGGDPVRVTFDRWDSMRVSRGEHPPYPEEELPEGYSAIYTVEGSRYLRERFAYESQHYARNYGFNNDVREMLEEFEHYLFCFHDEFVEVIAGGVWFDAPGSVHPLEKLPESATVERFVAHGIPCQVRGDPRPLEELLAASRFCDQSLYQLALELDGSADVSCRLTVRTRRGRTTSRWRGYFGAVQKAFDGVPTLDALRPLVEEHARAVAERRASMGRK